MLRDFSMGWRRCHWKTFDSGYPEMADDIPSMSQAGFFIRNARHLRLENVEVRGQVGEAFDIANSEDVTIIK